MTEIKPSGQGGQPCPDTELAARIEEIKKLQCKEVKPAHSISQKEAEKKVRLFSQIKNNRDGRIVEIPVNTIGKIIKNKGYDISKIVDYLPILYETSILGWSENEIQQIKHKTHPNIKKYHHYINKFKDGTNNYYIRFTLNEEKTKPGKTGKNYIHSTAISKTSIYKKTTVPIVSVIIGTGVKNSSSFIDKRLIDFFNSVK